ncbi:MAG: hypothetical protein ACYDHZ_02580, partial [Dehalococcoidia bacterium]
AITSTPVTAGTAYWLAFNMDVNCISYQQSGTTTRWFKSVPYSGFSFPATVGSGFDPSYTIFYDYITGWGAVTTSPGKLIGPADSTATGNVPSNYFILDRQTAASTGNITEIRVKCGAGGNVKVAIYADSSGSPGALLNAVNTGTAVTTGWNSIAITSTPVTAGTAYWLAFNMDVNCISYQQSGTTTRWFKSVPYSGFSFPSTVGSGFDASYTIFYDYITGWGG